MTRNSKKIILPVLGLLMFLGIFSTSFALNETYTVLAPLPCIGNGNDCNNTSSETTLSNYLSGAFKLAIGIGAVLAFVVITYGGILYATSDAITGKATGRDLIENAVWGLLLVIGAYAILYTINPQILNFSILVPTSTPTPATSAPIVSGGVRMTQAELDESNRIAAILGQSSIPCADGQTTRCVNYNGMQGSTISGILNLKIACAQAFPGCSIVITGGTEGGHSATGGHSQGVSVDIRPNTQLNNFIIQRASSLTRGVLTTCGIYVLTGTYLWEPIGAKCNGPVASTADHWHVRF